MHGGMKVYAGAPSAAFCSGLLKARRRSSPQRHRRVNIQLDHRDVACPCEQGPGPVRLTHCLRSCGLSGMSNVVPRPFSRETRRNMAAVARQGDRSTAHIIRDLADRVVRSRPGARPWPRPPRSRFDSPVAGVLGALWDEVAQRRTSWLDPVEPGVAELGCRRWGWNRYRAESSTGHRSSQRIGRVEGAPGHGQSARSVQNGR